MTRIYSLLLTLVFTSFSLYSQEGYKIDVEIDGLPAKEIYLGYHLAENKYIEDTAAMSNGKAVFQGTEPLKHGIYFLYTPVYFLEFVITAEQNFSVRSDTISPLVNKRIQESPENEIFHEFQLNMADTRSESVKLRERLKTAKNKKDTAIIVSQLESVHDANQAFQDQMTVQYPESFVTKLIRIIRRPETQTVPEGLSEKETRRYSFMAYKDKFFDGIDFGYPGILRTPVFHTRLMEYIDKLISPEPDSLIKEMDYLLNKAIDQEVFRYILVSITNKFSKSKLMGHDAVFVHLAENYYLKGKAYWADNEKLKGFRKAVNDLKPNLIGQSAPSLELLDTMLSPISLEDINAKYTLLFFYDPDCGHCKKEAPQALDFYHKFQTYGVEAVGVCVPTDLEKWRGFIDEKALDWINGADPYVQSNFRKEYNILSYPTIYVLDEDKKIIGKRLGVEQLEYFMNARLKMDED